MDIEQSNLSLSSCFRVFFHTIVSLVLNQKLISLDSRTGNTFTLAQLATLTLPYLTYLHNQWCSSIDGKNVTIIPTNIYELLAPMALAFWLASNAQFHTILCVIKVYTYSFSPGTPR